MKVVIDQDGCIECGACQQSCSEVFIINTGEKASVTSKYQVNSPNTGAIPDDLAACAEDAAASCPVQVITVE
jgi:ferredoxin